MSKSKESPSAGVKPLLLNGEDFHKAIQPPRPAIARLREFLSHSPENELFDPARLITLAAIARASIDSFIEDPENARYFCRIGAKRRVILGHPLAIARVNKEYGQ